ncbi:MAG TPA: serine/threonine protein kinase [Candidatus Caccousia avistercoris]|nr:serine/threonine protein kinase [Candidatus Caccousia avistercoris]
MGDAFTGGQLAAIAAAFVAAMGMPSAITGLIVWRLKKSIEARDAAQQEKNRAQQELILLLVQSTRASIALGEATAHAMQRGHTNGDTEAALRYAAEVKHRQKDFLAQQGIQAMMEE